jgi:hypothetical protein
VQHNHKLDFDLDTDSQFSLHWQKFRNERIGYWFLMALAYNGSGRLKNEPQCTSNRGSRFSSFHR